MKKTMLLITGLLVVLSIFVALATPFKSEAEARSHYNKLANSPRFIDIKIYDIISELDGTEYEVYWWAKVYDNAGKTGNSTFDITKLTRVSKNFTPVQIQSTIETEAKMMVNAWQPNKPKIQHTDHALYGKIIRIVG